MRYLAIVSQWSKKLFVFIENAYIWKRCSTWRQLKTEPCRMKKRRTITWLYVCCFNFFAFKIYRSHRFQSRSIQSFRREDDNAFKMIMLSSAKYYRNRNVTNIVTSYCCCFYVASAFLCVSVWMGKTQGKFSIVVVWTIGQNSSTKMHYSVGLA